jgi:hypothetical protein
LAEVARHSPRRRRATLPNLGPRLTGCLI